MLKDVKAFEKIYLVSGYTDCRKGINGLSALIETKFGMCPFQNNVLFLFCGHSCAKIRGIVWEQDGFLLLYKRIEKGGIHWPRKDDALIPISSEDFVRLISGYNIFSTVEKVFPRKTC